MNKKSLIPNSINKNGIVYPKKETVLVWYRDQLDENLLTDHYAQVITHINFVYDAGVKLKLNPLQLQKHDMSKWGLDEFVQYAAYNPYRGKRDIPEEIQRNYWHAWHHHMRHNQHHWQYWGFPAGNNIHIDPVVHNGFIEMPEPYAMEMVADWIGASMTYQGSEDMTEWLIANMPKIWLHRHTAEFVTKILYNLGYRDVIMQNELSFSQKT